MISRERLKVVALFGAIRSKLCQDFDQYWTGNSHGLLRAMPAAAAFLPELKEEALRLSRLDDQDLIAEIMSLPDEEEKLLRAALDWAEERDGARSDEEGGRR